MDVDEPCLIITPDLSSVGAVHALLGSEGRTNTMVYGCSEDLTFGPLWADIDSISLLRRRYHYWLSRKIVTAGDRGPRLQSLVRGAQRVEIWLNGEDREQALVIALISNMDSYGLDQLPLEIRQFNVEKNDIRSLAILSHNELKARPDALSVTPEVKRGIESLWLSLATDSPSDLFSRYRAGVNIDRLPFLDRALRAFILRYPDRMSGLGIAEHALLRAADPNRSLKAARVVADAMFSLYEKGARHGDIVLFDALIDLSRGFSPAIDVDGIGTEMRRTEVRLTDFGCACLEGKANWVAENGIDRWIGGIHLSSAHGRVWFRNGMELVG